MFVVSLRFCLRFTPYLNPAAVKTMIVVVATAACVVGKDAGWLVVKVIVWDAPILPLVSFA